MATRDLARIDDIYSLLESQSRARRLDVVGFCLAAALVLWTQVSGLLTKTDALGVALLVTACVATFAASRAITLASPALVPMVLAGITGLLLMTDPAGFLGREPSGYPFGYANAKGAFLVQACAACLLLVARSDSRTVKWLGLSGAAFLGLAPFVFDSRAAGFLAVLTIVAASIGTAGALSRRLLPAMGLLVLAALSATTFVGLLQADDPSSPVVRAAQEIVGVRRPTLWGDAVVIAKTSPLEGAGLNSFESLSPVARADEDARFVPNTFLGLSAEAGVVAGILLMLLFVWGYMRLGIASTSPLVIATGVGALTALGIHASVDYVLHFPAVPLAACAVLGAAIDNELERSAWPSAS